MQGQPEKTFIFFFTGSERFEIELSNVCPCRHILSTSDAFESNSDLGENRRAFAFPILKESTNKVKDISISIQSTGIFAYFLVYFNTNICDLHSRLLLFFVACVQLITLKRPPCFPLSMPNVSWSSL